MRSLQKNITYFYLSEFFTNLFFTLPIWVSFYRQMMSYSEMATLIGISVLINILLQLPTGAFADVFGRKKSCILGAIILVAAYIAVGLAPNKYFLVAAVIVRGVGEAFISGANISLVYDSLKELGRESEFAKVRTNAVLFPQISLIIGSIFGGYLYSIWDSLPYIFVAISYLICTVIYFFFKEPDIDSEKYTLKVYLKKIKSGFIHIFANKHIKTLSIYYIVVGSITMALQMQFNMIFAEAIGYNEVERGWLFAIIRFVNAFILIKLLRIDKFFTKSNPLLRFSIFVAIATIFGAINLKPLATIILFATTLANTLKLIVFDKLINAEFDSKLRATALSALYMLSSLAYTVITFVAGFVFDKYYPGIVYTVLGILIIVLIIPIVIKNNNSLKKSV